MQPGLKKKKKGWRVGRGQKADGEVIKGSEEARERLSRHGDDLEVRDRAAHKWGQAARDALRPGRLTVPHREIDSIILKLFLWTKSGFRSWPATNV